MIKIKYIFLLFLFFIFVPFSVKAQFDPHPELDWFTIETPHFIINYHSGTERTAMTAAKIAEDVYGPITSLYQHKPSSKTTFIITDVSDIANGAADYFGNRVSIFASPLDFDLRGTHNWLRNVITHEFTHIVQIQTAMKFAQELPAFYLQVLDYEEERRPDVLYGYPNVIVSYPISGVTVPAWFAEGTAQYQRQQLSYDYWDAHRDMILRMQVLGAKMLTWNEMGQFATITSLKAESIYNSGFALTRYIADIYGEDKLRTITDGLAELTNWSFDAACEDAIGKNGQKLYNEWQKYLQTEYNDRVAGIRQSELKGELIEKKGFANYYPKFSPDGKKISYLSNQDFDYGTTGLMLYDVATKKSKILTAPVATSYSWHPDGNKIIFAKRNTPPTIHHVTVFDLYEYNIKTEKETRLTTNMRAYSPAYSPDGKLICFVVNKDGTLNLQIADANGKNNDPITAFNDGEQVYNPVFSKDGKSIIFDYAWKESRKLAMIDITSGDMKFIIDKPGVDARNPELSADGKILYYSSNETGIFNVYSYNFDTKETKQITNVLGGAFMSSVDNNGNLVYSSYETDGYKISLYNNYSNSFDKNIVAYKRFPKLIEKYASTDSLTSEGKNNFNWVELREFDDSKIPDYKSKPYSNQFTQLSFFPVLRYDNYTEGNSFLDDLKPGLYIYSDEMLSRFSIFGGASINKRGERDLFLQFTYNNGVPFFHEFFTRQLQFVPQFSLEGYNVTRKTTADLIASVDTLGVGVEYNLLALDFSMAWKMFNVNHDFKFKYSVQKYSSIISPFVIPQSGIFVRSSSDDYFKSNSLGLEYNFDYTYPTKNSDINPIGRKVKLKYDYEMSDINPELEVTDDGRLISKFQTNKLHKVEGEWLESFGLFNNEHSLSFKLYGGTVFGPPVDDFYNYYVSGLPGMKGYPFYSLGGGRAASLNVTYRLPLLQNIDFRLSPVYFDKLYLSLYGDYGYAWNGSDVKLSDFKKDIGAQLRLQAFSFYVFPTSIFFDAAYGLDQFTREFRNEQVTYGKEWRFYFGVLFGFDI
ncbi:MAG: PD40 domain-containing protein [Ignavibacteria bacterium]|nr:PD40 domain-containing protein [Ignavibacteria bacterium]